MGWLGWTEQQTRATRIPSIELALAGILQKLKSCYGTGEPQPAKIGQQDSEAVKSMFRSAAGMPDS